MMFHKPVEYRGKEFSGLTLVWFWLLKKNQVKKHHIHEPFYNSMTQGRWSGSERERREPGKTAHQKGKSGSFWVVRS